MILILTILILLMIIILKLTFTNTNDNTNINITNTNDNTNNNNVNTNTNSRREGLIEERLGAIRAMTPDDIISEIGNIYRHHYNTRCLGVQWCHPLKTLQVSSSSSSSS